MNRTTRNTLAATVGLALMSIPATAADADEYREILDDRAQSIVKVRLIMNVSMGGQDREIPMEAAGVVLSEDGLVMVPGSALEMDMGMGGMGGRGRGGRGRGGGGGGGGGGMPEIDASPVDIRVMIGDDFEEYEAVVAAKDPATGLSFLMIRDTEDLKLKPVDFSKTDDAAIGEDLVGVARLGESNDFAPYFGRVQVTGKVEQPRVMWCISGNFARSAGLPLFNHDNELIGIIARQSGGEGGMRGMMRGGGGNTQGFLVPASQVEAVVKMAHERGRQLISGKEG